ncbi:MAG: hypothetical protein JSS75_03650 [Bacteroidetes bacterium]|nr:hypothetical protein [Bacteroidota bacterium]
MTVSLKAQVFQGKQVSHLSLVSGAVTPGKPFTLGIRLQLEPGWHTYWSTPGDAGTAMIVSLVNTPEYSIGPLQFPTPHKMVSEDLITYGYEDDVVFLVRVKPTSPAASHRLTFKINWLACLSVCLPAEATITFDLDSLSPIQAKEDQKLLDKWTARLPQPGAGFNLDKCAATYSVTKDNKYQVFIKFFQTAPDTITDFFPDDQENMVIEYNSIHATSDGVVMTIEPSTVGAPLEKLTGVALIGTTGYDVSIPVSKQ